MSPEIENAVILGYDRAEQLVSGTIYGAQHSSERLTTEAHDKLLRIAAYLRREWRAMVFPSQGWVW